MGDQAKPLLWLGAIFLLVGGLAVYLFVTEPGPSPADARARPAAAPTPAPSSAPQPESPGPSPAAPAGQPAAAPAAAGEAPWAECAVGLLDGAGRLVFLRKPSSKAGEDLRRLRIETPAPGETVELPPCAESSAHTNVYWYRREEKLGPFVRLLDREGEYLVTLRGRTVARMLRIRGETHVGVFVDGVGGFGWTEGPDGRIAANVSGKPAHRLQGRLADSQGQYLGRVEGGGRALRFVGGAESPERPFDTGR